MSKPYEKNGNITEYKIKTKLKNITSSDDVVSKYFSNNTTDDHIVDIPRTLNNDSATVTQFLDCCRELNLRLNELSFSPPVKCVYNPTEYAFNAFENYVSTYGNKEKKILFLGMNPGPWGMSQTGVPFGEIDAVKNWLKISGTINKPPVEDPSRPILGFDCHRSEVSGKRFWSLAKFLSGTPEQFFRNCFVHNYCPIQIIKNGGKNITPDELKKEERTELYKLCDEKLAEIIKIFKFNILIGIGKLAENRLNEVQKVHRIENIEKIYGMPHPSPRAKGNQDWQNKALEKLTLWNITEYFK